jgi:hypothetical protein
MITTRDCDKNTREKREGVEDTKYIKVQKKNGEGTVLT